MNPRATTEAIPRLTYFDVRGRAEVIRLILEETATPYEERRISELEWPAVKAAFPFQQVPIYEEGALLIHQSHAIYRYLARKHGLYGKGELERVRCDIVEESFVDLQNNLASFYWNPRFSEKRDEFEQSRLPELLGRAQQLLLENSGAPGFHVGAALTFVDFCAWHFLDYVRPFSQRTLDSFEALCAFKRRIESRPRIAAYLASGRRPATQTVSMAPFGGSPLTS